MNNIKQLIEISHYYGKNKSYVIAGGGNTSYKDEKYIWVKASGTTLADITEEGFAILNREKLKQIADKKYSKSSVERENQIKTDLFRACVYPERNLRPSVETSLHEIIDYIPRSVDFCTLATTRQQFNHSAKHIRFLEVVCVYVC